MNRETMMLNPIQAASFLSNAWARSRVLGAAQRGEMILNRMQQLYESGNHDMKPNTVSFSSVISAWSQSHEPAAPQRAETLLLRMQKVHEAGNHGIKPGTITFNSAISWAQSSDRDAGSRANRYLEYMKQVGASGHKDCGPTK